MALFPMFVDISSRKCVVVGGGRVALRKVQTLQRYGGDVLVISREICPEIQEILPADACVVMETGLKGAVSEETGQERTGPELEALLEEAILVVAASGDRQLNHLVAVFCDSHDIPVNVIDAPEECSFQFPAVVKRGEISVGINSGTNSPALTRLIRRKIGEELPDYYGDLADQLGRLRITVRELFPEEKDRRAILGRAAEEAFSRGRILTDQELKDLVREMTGGETGIADLDQS